MIAPMEGNKKVISQKNQGQTERQQSSIVTNKVSPLT